MCTEGKGWVSYRIEFFEEMKLPEISRSCSIMGKPALGDEDNGTECYSSIVQMSKPVENRNIHFHQKQTMECSVLTAKNKLW